MKRFLLLSLIFCIAYSQELKKTPFNILNEKLNKSIDDIASLNVLNIVLAVDTSGSMKKYYPEIKENLYRFVFQLEQRDKLTLISFDAEAQALIFSQPQTAIQQQATQERIRQLQARGLYTDLEKAYLAISKIMETIKQQAPNEKGLVLIITDNEDDPPPNSRTKKINLKQMSQDFYEGVNWDIFTLKISNEETETLSFSEHFLRSFQGRIESLMTKPDDLLDLTKDAKKMTRLKLYTQLAVGLLFVSILIFFIFKKSLLFAILSALALFLLFFFVPESILYLGQIFIWVTLIPFRILGYPVMGSFLVWHMLLSVLLALLIYRFFTSDSFLDWLWAQKSMRKDMKILSGLMYSQEILKRKEAIAFIYKKAHLRRKRQVLLQKIPFAPAEAPHLIPHKIKDFQKEEVIKFLNQRYPTSFFISEKAIDMVHFINTISSAKIFPEKVLNMPIHVDILFGPPAIHLLFKNGHRLKLKLSGRGSNLTLKGPGGISYSQSSFLHLLKTKQSTLLSMMLHIQQPELKDKGCLSCLLISDTFSAFQVAKKFARKDFIHRTYVIYDCEQAFEWSQLNQIRGLSTLGTPVHILLQASPSKQENLDIELLKEMLRNRTEFQNLDVIMIDLETKEKDKFWKENLSILIEHF